MNEKETTEQENNKNQEEPKKVPNPEGKGGFGDHPENINYGGRPKNEESPTYWLRKFLSEVDPKSNTGKKRIQEIAEKFAILAYLGNVKAMEAIFDRLDGKAPQTIKHQGEIDLGMRELAGKIDKLIELDESNSNGGNKNSR